ncbi:MAG: YggU family protein [Spirochaetaceae bacterium]|nr:MAG: YggU family protein [Spirochaetaceae bacterium]
MSDEAKPFTTKAENLILKVRVIPKSVRNQIVGARNGELVLRIRAPALKGQANRELMKFLAKAFAVSKSEIVILSGETSRHKLIRLPVAAKRSVEEAL